MADDPVVGDLVEVDMPARWAHGKVVAVLPNYSWTGETKYEIHGNDFVTITSARSMRAQSSHIA